MEDFKDELVCPQCKNDFNINEKEPRMLQCGHSICLQCVTQKILQQDEGSVYRCPEDNNEYYALKDQSNYPKNIMLLKMIQRFSQSLAVQQQIIQNKNFNQSNMISPFKQNQQLENASQSSQSTEESAQQMQNRFSEDNLCTIHLKRQDIICATCKERICANCALFGSHKNHDVKREEDLMREITKRADILLQIFDKVEQVQGNLQNSVNADNFNLFITELQNNQIKDINHYFNVKLQNFPFYNYFQNLKSQIEVQEKMLIYQIENHYKQYLIKIKEQIKTFTFKILEKSFQWKEWYSFEIFISQYYIKNIVPNKNQWYYVIFQTVNQQIWMFQKIIWTLAVMNLLYKVRISQVRLLKLIKFFKQNLKVQKKTRYKSILNLIHQVKDFSIKNLFVFLDNNLDQLCTLQFIDQNKLFDEQQLIVQSQQINDQKEKRTPLNDVGYMNQYKISPTKLLKNQISSSINNDDSMLNTSNEEKIYDLNSHSSNKDKDLSLNNDSLLLKSAFSLSNQNSNSPSDFNNKLLQDTSNSIINSIKAQKQGKKLFNYIKFQFQKENQQVEIIPKQQNSFPMPNDQAKENINQSIKIVLDQKKQVNDFVTNDQEAQQQQIKKIKFKTKFKLNEKFELHIKQVKNGQTDIADFSCAELGDEGIILISEAIYDNQNIKSLKLVRNKISDGGALFLLNVLENNSNVCLLNLSSNSISEVFLDKLIELFQNQKLQALKQIYLNQNLVKESKCKKKIEILKKLGIQINI